MTYQDLVPEVGMGVTQHFISDCVAYTVIAVYTNKAGAVNKIDIQEDTAIRTDNNQRMSDSQAYRFERNPQGARFTLTKRNDGKWRELGTNSRVGYSWRIGERWAYRDFSF